MIRNFRISHPKRPLEIAPRKRVRTMRGALHLHHSGAVGPGLLFKKAVREGWGQARGARGKVNSGDQRPYKGFTLAQSLGII